MSENRITLQSYFENYTKTAENYITPSLKQLLYDSYMLGAFVILYHPELFFQLLTEMEIYLSTIMLEKAIADTLNPSSKGAQA